VHMGERPKEGEKVIFLDFDSTLFDLLPPWIEAVNAEYDEAITLDQITMWDWSVLSKGGTDVYKLRTPAMYERIKPVKWAQLGVRWLSLTGATLHCLTTDKPEFYDVKRRKLDEFFPEVKDLWVVEGKEDWYRPLLIDDRPKNFEGVGAGIILTQPYNVDWELPANVVRMDNWVEMVTAMGELHKRGHLNWLWPKR
jgi:5'(3')-deoxyribonucleotidase